MMLLWFKFYKVWKLSILVDHGYEFQKKRENNGEFALNFPNQSY